jgi:hypothetical protein
MRIQLSLADPERIMPVFVKWACHTGLVPLRKLTHHVRSLTRTSPGPLGIWTTRSGCRQSSIENCILKFRASAGAGGSSLKMCQS